MSRDPVLPEFSYPARTDDEERYFLYVDHKGHITKKSEIFHAKEFEDLLLNYDEETIAAVYEYIEGKIREKEEFSAGTLFPNPWPEEIMPLYDNLFAITGNPDTSYEHAAYVLTGIIQKIVMKSEYGWVVSRTQLPSRDFATLYYYRNKMKKS